MENPLTLLANIFIFGKIMHKQQLNMIYDFNIMKIENFGDMQARYLSLPLSSRASAVLSDVAPAFSISRNILEFLQHNPEIAKAVANLRNNALVVSRIRNSEAKSSLMDETVDFIKTTSQKLEKWQNILQQIAQEETKAYIAKDNIPEQFIIVSGSSYLSLLKLVIPELIKLDAKNREKYESMLAELRRCTTILSDCECASELNSVVLH